MIELRLANDTDRAAVGAILEPVVRAGETLTLPRTVTAAEAASAWFAPGHTVTVATEAGRIVGAYYLRANATGGGAHVANAGYVVAGFATGRGVGRAMGHDSLVRARAAGFAAMQFNFVVASNTAAVALWHSLGFATVGRLPGAFAHPRLGVVDALVMFRGLGDLG